MNMLHAEEIAERLSARRSGAGWIARCPAHEDRSPSLSISERDGKVLLHCFASCTIEAVCDAIGIQVRDLFLDACQREWKPPYIREAEKQISDLRSRLTRSERDRPVTVIYCDPQSLDVAIARALALTVEQEIVQLVLDVRP
jgi:hypothetical protein